MSERAADQGNPPTDVQGSCLCGRIAYAATPPFAQFVACHCSHCRKASGSSQAVNAAF